MKKLLVLALIVTLGLVFLTSCDIQSLIGSIIGQNTPPDNTSDEQPAAVDIAEGGLKVYLDSNKLNVKQKFDRFVKNLENELGITAEVTDTADGANIVYSISAGGNENAMIGSFSMELAGTCLTMKASDLDTMAYVESVVVSFADGAKLSVDEAELKSGYLNLYDYKNKHKVTLYNEDELSALTILAEVKINGAKIAKLDPYKTSLNLGISYKEGFPEVAASAAGKGATVDIVQPTEENGGKCTVTVNALGKSATYSLSFYVEDGEVGVTIVNKDDKEGVITFVIDDGVVSTAEYLLNDFFPKYENLKASFAVKTKELATLHKVTDENGNLVWETDDNGKYVYDVNTERVNFWKSVLATGQAEVLSHSHTHSYWGDNDNGGSFEYTKNDGTTATSEVFPKGNVTMELLASQQIVYDLLGEVSYGFVKPGVGAKLSTYYTSLLEVSGFYTSARGTVGSDNLVGHVNYAINFRQVSRRFNVYAYAIEHYDSNKDKPTDKYSSYEECIAAGIVNWKTYIDAAINGGGWACFCIHDIRPERYEDLGSTAHYIYASQADALFGYADSLADRAWIATYNEAAQYYICWSTADIKAEIVNNEKITVTFNSGERDERNRCPLTVKVDVPYAWAGVETATGTELEILTDDEGQRYILVDVAPNSSVSFYEAD